MRKIICAILLSISLMVQAQEARPEWKWTGQWIGLEHLQPNERGGLHPILSARYFKNTFKLKHQVKQATAYVIGLGNYRLFINKKEVAPEEVLKQVPSDYRKTLYYNAYDVTDMLTDCDSAEVMIELGSGRYFTQRQNRFHAGPIFGKPKCRVNIDVLYSDGSKQTWSTNSKWKMTTQGPVRNNNIYDGETYDARKELRFLPDSAWQRAQLCLIPDGDYRQCDIPPIVASRLGNPLSITQKGDTAILDFGQNISGWVNIHARAQKGDTIRLLFAERLASNGNLYRDNLRSAQCLDTYVSNGEDQWWHPSFVTHGFRYVGVTGQRNPTKEDFEAYYVADSMKSLPVTKECYTGFVTSNEVLNKIVRNAWWGIKSNYQGFPIDCPQRDERQPWLGDRTVGALGESYLFDNAKLYRKWMRDICESQRSDGELPDVAPAYWHIYTENVTWPAALPFICDMLYRQYADSLTMKQAYPHIKKWLLHIIDAYRVDPGIIGRDKYGDWCVPPESLEIVLTKDSTRLTDGKLIATAYTIACMRIAGNIARIIGSESEAGDWFTRAEEMKKAFNDCFLVDKSRSGRSARSVKPNRVFYGNNTPTANILALAFRLVPDSLRPAVVASLVYNLEKKNHSHVNCGVIGISWLLRTLSENGHANLAYKIATQTTYPSWGYMLEQGATTIWELWNGNTANPKMNSGNHVMLLGDLLTWCYQYLAGIRPLNAGYGHFVVKPSFAISHLDSVNAAYPSHWGLIKSSWKKSGKSVTWQVEVPQNCQADLYFPDGKVQTVKEGHHSFTFQLNGHAN
ncbi:MAG: family 78 glycoside hydrolase catalytic domain [Prevotella sp.]|jgi:alpha-L-rhamnosidase